MDATSNSVSSNKTHICQTHTRETPHLDQSPEAGKGRDLSVTHDYATGEAERQLSERLIELEKEVCICEYISGNDVCACVESHLQDVCAMVVIYIMLKFLL